MVLPRPKRNQEQIDPEPTEENTENSSVDGLNKKLVEFWTTMSSCHVMSIVIVEGYGGR